MAGAYEWWDQEVTIYGRDAACSVVFPDHYIPYVAPEVTVRQVVDGLPAAVSVQVSNEPAFRREWSAFADCISSGKPPRTTIQGGLDDMQLIGELVRCSRAG